MQIHALMMQMGQMPALKRQPEVYTVHIPSFLPAASLSQAKVSSSWSWAGELKAQA